MAKRKTQVHIEHQVGQIYHVWMDDDLRARVRGLEGVQEISPRPRDGYWVLWVDPRYDAAEVIADIKALGNPEPCHGDAFGLKSYARTCAHDLACWVDFPLSNRLGLSDAVVEIMGEIERQIKEMSCDTDADNWLWGLHARILNRLQYRNW